MPVTYIDYLVSSAKGAVGVPRSYNFRELIVVLACWAEQKGDQDGDRKRSNELGARLLSTRGSSSCNFVLHLASLF